jgi:hypothetical protein
MYKMPKITFYYMDHDSHDEQPVYWYGTIEQSFEEKNDLLNWMKENFTDNYKIELKYNSGYPKFFYRLYDAKDAMLLKLTFIGANDE